MSDREPFIYLEVDIDYCDLSYATGACQAVLGTTGKAKCFNTYGTCQDKENFTLGTKTIKFCKNIKGIPKGELFFPIIESITTSSSSVNIAGFDKRYNAFGKRADLKVRLVDIPYHDRFLDKYQRERLSGVAIDGGQGYDPASSGSLLARLLTRWPHYAERAARVVESYIDNGTIDIFRTSYYNITDFAKDDRRVYTLEARDPLNLANNDKAVLPLPTNGVTAEEINSTADGVEFNLSPEGIGDSEYPTSGRAYLGSEYFAFTRSGDTMTMTERGIKGTTASTHAAEDRVQNAYFLEKGRPDEFLEEILLHAGIDAARLPTSTWQAEVDRWTPNVKLEVDLVSPEGVADLGGELATIGFSIWYDDIDQLVGFKTIRPPDGDVVHKLTDKNSIKSFKSEKRDKDRITEVYFSTRIKDPSLDEKNSKSYLSSRYIIDVASKVPEAFGQSGAKVKKINSRLLNQGADDVVRMLGRRILNRNKLAPELFTLQVDNKDRNIRLTDVLEVETESEQNEDGSLKEIAMQVVRIKPLRIGHDFEIEAIAYDYSGRLGYCMENTASSSYDTATDEERLNGNFAVDENTLKFSDGSEPYEAI